MNKVYLITYSFKEDESDYHNLFKTIKENFSWWHFLDNTWLISTTENANSIYDKLKPYLDADINILIIEVGKDRQGWLPKKAWEWIRKNLGKKSNN